MLNSDSIRTITPVLTSHFVPLDGPSGDSLGDPSAGPSLLPTPEAPSYRQLVDLGPLIDDILADAARAYGCDKDELLTLGAADQESGYHPDHQARLVREGRIPDRWPPGHRCRILIRRETYPPPRRAEC